MSVLRVLPLFSLFVAVTGHADFLLVDASYRLNAEGKLYCSAAMGIGSTIMNFPVVESTEANVELSFNKTNSGDIAVIFSAPGYDYVEFVFETESGVFEDGGCQGKRSALNGDLLIGADENNTVSVAYSGCTDGGAPGSCQVYYISKTI